MPTVLVTTVSESGQVNIGPYSLCFPYIIAGDKYAMMLICRDSSNTAENIRRTGVCALNFIPDDKKLLKNCVMLGYPGETTEEKMKNSIFTLIPAMREKKKSGIQYPDVIAEAVQVYECNLDKEFDYNVFEGANNFVLKIEDIFLRPELYDAIIHGMEAKSFPRLPVDYGFRDNIYFWFTKGSKPFKEPIPEEKGQSLNTVMYAAKRVDPEIEWMEEACEKIVRVPRVFLKRVIAGCVEEAKAQGLTKITPEFMDALRDKRNEE